MSNIKILPEDLRLKLLDLNLKEEEIKILEAWRYIKFGQITAYKKNNELSGRIDIKTTY